MATCSEERWEILGKLVRGGQTDLARAYAERHRREDRKLDLWIRTADAIREGVRRGLSSGAPSSRP